MTFKKTIKNPLNEKKGRNFWLSEADIRRLEDVRLTLARQGLITSFSKIVAIGILHLSQLSDKELFVLFQNLIQLHKGPGRGK